VNTVHAIWPGKSMRVMPRKPLMTTLAQKLDAADEAKASWGRRVDFSSVPWIEAS
jgi:hypothetical protein